LKARDQQLFGARSAKPGAAAPASEGLNLNVFGSSTDLMDVMRAKRGVAIRNGRTEIGAERYQPTNPHSMSRDEYQEFAEQHVSLASIAQRGASQQLQLNDPSVGVESGAELTMDSLDRPPKVKQNQSQ